MLTVSKKERINYFELLLDTAPIGVILLDKNGKIVELNRTVSFEFDLSPEEACGKNIADLFSKIERKRLSEFLSTAITLSQRSPYEIFQAIPKRDMARFVELTATHFIYKDKHGLLVTLRNVTNTVSLLSRAEEARNKSEEYSEILAKREIELERSNAELNTILEGGADAIVVRDNKWNLVYANKATLDLYGMKTMEEFRRVSAEKMLQRFEITDKSGKPTKETDLPGMKAIRLKKKVSSNLCFKRKGEAEGKWYLVHSNPIFDKEKNAWLVVNILHNVTSEIREEKNREVFLGMASHELKTPLAVIKAFVQLIEIKNKKKFDSRTREYLKKIDRQIDRLTKLTNDMLDATRMSAGKMKFIKKKFDLDSLIDKTLRELEPTSANHRMVRRGRIKTEIYGDEERIEQVLANLIRNAMKYSPGGGKIYVHTQKKDGEVVVGVQDFGIGIAPKDQKKIFKTYKRVISPTTKSIEGMGMGLYIASAIVKAHSGKIWVRSEEGKGSNFFFSLPLNLH